MSISTLNAYIRIILSQVNWRHLVIIWVLALGITLLFRKKYSKYGTTVIGITIFIGLFLLDIAVVNRYFGVFPHVNGCRLNLHRLIHNDEQGRIELFANLAVFIPFGFFLCEFFASTKRFGAWRRIGLSSLTAFGLSLCIELLQLFLKVGVFEVTDLVLNTMGGVIGALLSVGRRCIDSILSYDRETHVLQTLHDLDHRRLGHRRLGSLLRKGCRSHCD